MMILATGIMGGTWQHGCEINGPSFKTDGSEQTTEQPDYLSVIEPTEPQSEREANQQWIGQYGLYDRLSRDEALRNSTTEIEGFFAERTFSNMGKLHAAIEGFQAARSGETEAVGLLSQVQPINRAESTLKEVLELLYNNATDLSGLTAQEVEQAREIARRCPLDDGFGVYVARAALLKVDTFPRNYTNECELAQPFDDKRNKTHIDNTDDQVNIYPNPNSGEFTIELPLTEEDAAVIEVYGLLGDKIFGTQVSDGGKSSVILPSISPGIYAIRVTVGGELRYSERLTIVK